MTIYLPDEDRSYLSRSYMLDRIAGLLGGRAAEQLVWGISPLASPSWPRKSGGTYGMSEQRATAFDAGHDEVFIGKSMGPDPAPPEKNGGAEMDGDPPASWTTPTPAAPPF